MAKIDFKKELKHLYSASAKEPALVDVPEMNFLMIDGTGDPNASEFQEAVEALYAVSFTGKFAIKQAQGIDYVVPPLEGLWWAEDMAQFSTADKDSWLWTAMIMQPEWVTAELVEDAAAQSAQKKDLPALPRMRLDSYAEGFSAQIMHIGPYADEGPTIEKLHAFITESGHNKIKCNDYCFSELSYLVEEYKVGVVGCGLCQTEVVCEFRNPVKKLNT